MSEWTQHGEFELAVFNRVVVAHLAGGWNLEAALAYDQQFRDCAAKLAQSGQPWAHLVTLDDWSLGVPEINPVIDSLVGWCTDHGLQRAAHVYAPSVLKRVHLQDLVRPDGRFELRHFDQLDSAVSWLHQQGFELPAIGEQSPQGSAR
ncbi:hypothetical protein [Bacterioplanes sanyensis]|uniref:hypothetical protein n=1 Tax=Bacterioplanes sanyensis TaxID=1249553 RepID=UPI0012FD55A0|nr:hypothetical protein [Bacterioplanes sanyensis]